jgi:hypothetical protein
LKNDTGRTIGKIVKPVYSGDILIGALKQELSAAGYTVRFVQKLPKNVTNGIDISRISAELEQTSGLLALDGTCNLQINVDMWQSGTKVSTHHYASIVSDYSVMAQDQLLFNLMTKATQDITG